MPIVQISLVEGRDPALVKTCIKEVARAVHRSLGAPMSAIRVVVHQVPAACWSVGDETRDEIDATKVSNENPPIARAGSRTRNDPK